MKTRIKKSLITLTACLLTVAAQHSAFSADPDPAAVEAAKKMMSVMEVQKQMAPAMEGMKQMQSAMLDQQGLSDEQKAQALELMEASTAEVDKILNWENMEPMLVRVYVSTFSADEMNRLSAFFESPDGRVFVEKQPQLQAAMMMEMQKLMTTLMPKIQKSTQEAIERIKNAPPQN